MDIETKTMCSLLVSLVIDVESRAEISTRGNMILAFSYIIDTESSLADMFAKDPPADPTSN